MRSCPPSRSVAAHASESGESGQERATRLKALRLRLRHDPRQPEQRRPTVAQKMQVLLTCDLEDGDKPGSQTMRFAVDGSSYEIDLCDKHAKQMRDALARYVASGRRVSQAGSRRLRSSGGGDRERTQAIRAWARKKGIKVSERGRLSADIVAKYEASGGK